MTTCALWVLPHCNKVARWQNEKRFLDSFTLVGYNNLPYPEGYKAEIQEVAAHFDKDSIVPTMPYSLHTEYSYGKRKFDTEWLSAYPVIRVAHKDGVPQLWKSDEWAEEFAHFIIGLTVGQDAPTVMEIHPPFHDYCTLDEFADRFCVFEYLCILCTKTIPPAQLSCGWYNFNDRVSSEKVTCSDRYLTIRFFSLIGGNEMLAHLIYYQYNPGLLCADCCIILDSKSI